MPPSGFSKKAVIGALEFVRACYGDLLSEVKSGKHATYEKAIEYELSQINKALSEHHISSTGKLVKKSKK